MRVASVAELAGLLGRVSLFGDDHQAPWFRNTVRYEADRQVVRSIDEVCYYTESDNSRHVFDFLALDRLRRAQLSGLEPMALQDLGSAKHQAELHTLALLILLHRLQTFKVAGLPKN